LKVKRRLPKRKRGSKLLKLFIINNTMRKVIILVSLFLLAAMPFILASNDFAYNRLYDGVSIGEASDSSTTFFPVTNTTTAGTYLQGNISSISGLNDGLNYSIQEAMGAAPVLTFNVNFTDVDDFDFVVLNAEYMGSTSHQLELEIYEPEDDDWEGEYQTITTNTKLVYYLIPVGDAEEHIDDDGTVQVRIRHIQNGISSHWLAVDYLVLNKGGTILTSNMHDSLTARDDILNNHPNSDDVFWANDGSSTATGDWDLNNYDVDLGTGALKTGSLTLDDDDFTSTDNTYTHTLGDGNPGLKKYGFYQEASGSAAQMELGESGGANNFLMTVQQGVATAFTSNQLFTFSAIGGNLAFAAIGNNITFIGDKVLIAADTEMTGGLVVDSDDTIDIQYNGVENSPSQEGINIISNAQGAGPYYAGDVNIGVSAISTYGGGDLNLFSQTGSGESATGIINIIAKASGTNGGNDIHIYSEEYNTNSGNIFLQEDFGEVIIGDSSSHSGTKLYVLGDDGATVASPSVAQFIAQNARGGNASEDGGDTVFEATNGGIATTGNFDAGDGGNIVFTPGDKGVPFGTGITGADGENIFNKKSKFNDGVTTNGSNLFYDPTNTNRATFYCTTTICYYYGYSTAYTDIHIGKNLANQGIHYDASLGRVGINDDTPYYPLDVVGTIRSTDDLRANDNVDVGGRIYVNEDIVMDEDDAVLRNDEADLLLSADDDVLICDDTSDCAEVNFIVGDGSLCVTDENDRTGCGTTDGTAYADDFVEYSYVTNLTDKEAYELYIYAQENYYKNGVKNYSAWGECYRSDIIPDRSKPEIKTYEKEDCRGEVCFNETLNKTIYPYNTTSRGTSLNCKALITQKAMVYQTGIYSIQDSRMVINNTLIAEHYVTNTTKDPETLTKIENFYSNLNTKTYKEMKEMVLTPDGKLSENILFNYEKTDYGSYNLEGIGHSNRAMIVFMLWKIAKVEKEQKAQADCWDLPLNQVQECMREIQ